MVYGRPRKRKQERSDSGQPKLKKLKTGVTCLRPACRSSSELSLSRTKWCCAASAIVSMRATKECQNVWSHTRAAERDFLAKKRQEAFFDAISDGHLPSHETSAVDKAGAKQHRNHLLGLKNDRAKDETKRREALTHSMIPINPDKHHVYFATDIPLHHAQAAINGAGGCAPRVTKSLVDADCFVIKDFSFTNDLSIQLHPLAWAACLRGGVLADMKYIDAVVNRKGNACGGTCCFAFKTALVTSKKCWCSTKFQGMQLHRVLQSCANQRSSNWRQVSMEEFVLATAKKDCGLSAIAFVADDEKDRVSYYCFIWGVIQGQLQNVSLLWTTLQNVANKLGSRLVAASDFLDKFARIDSLHSTKGICGL